MDRVALEQVSLRLLQLLVGVIPPLELTHWSITGRIDKGPIKCGSHEDT